MADLKRIDQAENENRKLRNINFQNFPLEQFSDAGKVANKGDPQLKAAADNELYELEKHTIQMDMNNNTNANTSTYTEDNVYESADEYASPNTIADEYANPNTVSHMQYETNSKKFCYDNDDNMLRKTLYRPTYVPYKEDGQKILLPQSTDMS